jgi:hypothetical protein
MRHCSFLAVCVALGLAGLCGPALAAQRLPEGTVRIGAQLFEEGKLQTGVIDIWLDCVLGDCTLSRTEVYTCVGGYWEPSSATVSTKDGTLRILSSQIGLPSSSGETTGTLLLEERYPAAWYHYRFDFTVIWDKKPVIRYLTGLEGNIVVSLPRAEPVRWKLVPLKGREVRIKPSCDLRLRGLPDDVGR